MKREYTKTHENIIFLALTNEQVAWQQTLVQEVQEERRYYRTLPERVERWRMEQKLDEMYEGEKGTS